MIAEFYCSFIIVTYSTLYIKLHMRNCVLLVNVLPTTASACVVVTADEAVRGGKTIALKSIVDEAVQDCQCVQRVLVSRRTGADVAMTQRDIQLEKVSLTLHRTTAKLTLTHTHTHTHCRRCLRCQTRVSLSLWIVRILCSCSTPQAPLASQRASSTLRLATSSMPPSHNRSPPPNFLSPSHTHYHTHCILQYVFDYRPGDVYACVADIGWITGHSYVVYGPLCNGATTVLFESGQDEDPCGQRH